uniref:Aminotran_5 domain-containing protein n=1 Tax=Steinernema glaseri TaxID=37863 RepID=A0A1I8AMK9_9BILA
MDGVRSSTATCRSHFCRSTDGTHREHVGGTDGALLSSISGDTEFKGHTDNRAGTSRIRAEQHRFPAVQDGIGRAASDADRHRFSIISSGFIRRDVLHYHSGELLTQPSSYRSTDASRVPRRNARQDERTSEERVQRRPLRGAEEGLAARASRPVPTMDVVVQILGYFNSSAAIDGIQAAPVAKADKNELIEKRNKMIGSTCEIFYKDDPFVVTRGEMQYLFDDRNRKFIDCISNVQHVGHSHPTVVNSIHEQLSRSTCNVRFMSDKLTECAEALLKTLPPELDTILFCNSGSEANDLALRLARDYTKHYDAIVLENAYHGHLTSTMEMSPYKFDHGCSIPQPDWVHVAPTPDTYRGRYRLADDEKTEERAVEQGKKYSADVLKILEDIRAKGRGCAVFISEALQSCGGQILPPQEYFVDVANHMHAHGGLVVIDEVQTGFGRVGSSFWAHQMHAGFVPDIVTMGKPMGNGFPVAAVATRKEIADSLGGNVGYFNTYGGNPVACAAVLGVLKAIEEDNLLEHSKKMGVLFEKELHKLHVKHECVGDVRGVGMFWGIDLVKDRKTREPDQKLALALIMKLRKEYGVLLNADGPHTNILKYKPPLQFNESDLMVTVEALDSALTELTAQRNA